MPGAPRGSAPARGRGPFPIHPLLLAAFFVLFLFAENADQQVTLEPLLVPLGASVAGAAGLTLVLAGVYRSWLRGALVASAAVAAFFAFGHAWNLLRDAFDDRSHLAAIFALGVLAVVLLAWRGGGWVLPLSRAANVAAIVLVGVNVFRLAQFALGVPPQSVVAAAPVALRTPAAEIERRPDIYYLIFDRYSNAETLERIYGFDNRPFLDELERRGFTIAEDSWANYLKTSLSLLSSLNMEFLDGPALKAAGGASLRPLHTAFRDHMAVPATLKALGYEYVHIGSAWEPTATNVDADRVVRWRPNTGFTASLLGTTAWSLTGPDVPPGTEEEPPTELDVIRDHLRQDTLFQFDRLEEVAGRPGPTYVFAHVLLPHNPWRFNADGSLPTDAQRSSRTRTESYLEHVRYTNARILGLLDRLLDVPPGEEPVIILQADEGEFPVAYERNQTRFNWLRATPDQVQNKYGILNALHLPGVDPAAVGVHDRMSPVNVFRVVFNAYFDAGLPLLPDTVWLSPDHYRIYEFVEYERP